MVINGLHHAIGLLWVMAVPRGSAACPQAKADSQTSVGRSLIFSKDKSHDTHSTLQTLLLKNLPWLPSVVR